MKFTIKSIGVPVAGLIVAGMLAAGGSVAKADEIPLIMSSSHPPIVPWVKRLKTLVIPKTNEMLAAQGSKHRIKWTEAFAGALYDFNNTLEGLEEGLGDIGWVGTLWEPVKMPLHNVTYYASFAVYDENLLLKIQNDFEANYKPFQDEWARHNLVFLGSQVGDSYQLMTKKPIHTVGDVKGLKLLAAGAIAALTTNTGAVAVNAGLPVFYNNMQTGVADGCIIITTGMIPFKLYEVAPYITRVNFGGVISGAMAMNKDTWDGLPKDVQEVFTKVGKMYGDAQTADVIAFEKASFKKLPSLGAHMSVFPEAERRKWANTLADVAGDWAREWDAKGVPASQTLKKFMDAVRAGGAKPMRNWGS